MMPSSVPSASTTATPVSRSTMRRAASATVASGATERTSVAMRSASSMAGTLREQQERRLQVALDGAQETGPVGARGGAVVDGEADQHPLPRDDLAVDHGGARLDRTDGEDPGLRRVDDGPEARDAEHAQVGDGEGAAGDLVLLELAVAGAAGEVAGVAGQLAQALPIGVTDDRHDQSVVERDREADVGVRVAL